MQRRGHILWPILLFVPILSACGGQTTMQNVTVVEVDRPTRVQV